MRWKRKSHLSVIKLVANNSMGLWVEACAKETSKEFFFFTTKQTGLYCLPGGEGLCREDGLEVLGANPGVHDLLEPDQLATSLLVVLVKVVPTKPRFSLEGINNKGVKINRLTLKSISLLIFE